MADTNVNVNELYNKLREKIKSIHCEKDIETVEREFERLIVIPETYAVEVCPMYKGTEIFIGASREAKFGHQVLCGLGGIFIEVLKDVQASLAPIGLDEAHSMILVPFLERVTRLVTLW